jgi:glycerophosphoryl diester phosphodiesterase
MLLIAHRGASGHAPENTLAAFRLALEMGAEAVEFDVHQTADRELAVIHDEDLRRVAGRGEQIRDLTWQELLRFDVGSWFDPRFHDEKVPRLEQVFDLLSGKAELHLEIKAGSSVYPGIEESVVAFLRRRRALQSCLVSSFDHRALSAVRALEPRTRLGYLLGDTPLERAWKEIKELKAESLNLSRRQACPKTAAACHRRGLKLLVYTVNEAEEARRLAGMRADGVFSNYPELLSRDR